MATCANTWTTWNSTSTSTSGDAWYYWCNSGTTASTISTVDLTWEMWCSTSTTSTGTSVYRSVRDSSPPTEEQIRASEEARRRMDERIRQDRLAEERAEQCLVENLDEEQRRSWREKNHFVVHGRRNLRYRVRKFAAGNIDVVDEKGKVIERYCVHCASHAVPKADQLLAQKLHLELNEDEVHRVANKHGATGEIVLPALH